jgi:hypothetical protein
MTGGVARVAIKPNSKKARTANASEKQLKVQKAQLRQMKKGSTAANIDYIANADPSSVKWAMGLVFGVIYLVLALTYPVLWLGVALAIVLVIGTKWNKHSSAKKNEGKLTAEIIQQHREDRIRDGQPPNDPVAPARSPTPIVEGPPVYWQATASGIPSKADELMKFDALRQSGVLSQEEFDAEKAKLLAASPANPPASPV